MNTFGEWFSWCSFNSGDTKYACEQAWNAGFEACKREAVAVKPVVSDEEIKNAGNMFNDKMAGDDVSRMSFIEGAKWMRSKLNSEQGER